MCGKPARTVRRAGTGNGATERSEAPAPHAKAAGNSYSPRPTVTAPVPDSTDGQMRVGEEEGELLPLPEGVVDGLAHRATGQVPCLLG